MRGLATELMRGAVDLHTHGQPEVGLDIPKRLDDWEWAACARDLGMRAIVLKSHLWPTMVPAFHLRHMVPDILVLGSITLNSVVGGVDPWVVEAAARLGARLVFMPTWSAAHDLRREAASKSMKGWFPRLEGLTPDKGISVVDTDGRLLPCAREVLAVAHAHKLALSTSHLSPVESIALAEEAARIGFRRLVFGHPHSGSVGASDEQILRMAELGATIELCFLSLLPFQRLEPQRLLRLIRDLSPEKCVLTTDYFREWCPSAPEMLRMFIGILLQLGIGADAIRTMVQVNPSRLLGLDEAG
ncbi:MAG: hypothetical protein HYV93_15320 [Candidatus Rokubacteria bacterium]|nr:hypothetical protein [Candidatus Rokubacteria bacterium]